MSDSRLAVQEEPRETIEDLGVARRNAILRNELEEFSYNLMNITDGDEAAGEGGELFADGVHGEKLALISRMVEAQRGVRRVAKHAASTAVRVGKLAEASFLDGVAGAS